MLRERKMLAGNYLIKQLPRATVYLNKKFEIIHASDTWISYFCIKDHDIIGKSIFRLMGCSKQQWRSALSKCLDGIPAKTTQERHLDETGNEKWFEWSAIPWYNEEENVVGVIVEVEDVTKKVDTQLELEKLKFLLHEKSEIAKIGSWEYCATSNKVTWCPMTRMIHEVPEGYVPTLEKGIDFYKTGYSRNTISMVVDRAISIKTPWSEKLQIVTANGTEKWVIAAGKPVYKDEEFKGLIGTFQDVSDQVLADMKIRENEQLLNTLIDHLPLNVFIKDRQFRKILVNKSECDYLGVSGPEEVLGKTDEAFYDKETARITKEDDVNVMTLQKPILGEERTSIKNNGEKVTFLTSKIPLVGEDNSTNGLVGISMDITSLKQKEEELMDLINVTSLQNKKLVNFAHIVSHNLRSHAANFSMLLDFLVNEEEESEKRNIIDMLLGASDNLMETLDNLNEVVAIRTNANREKEEVNLNGRIRNVLQGLTSLIIENRATIVNTVPDTLSVNGVPAYVDSILINFITNAIKYKSPDRDPVINLSATKKRGYTLVSIEDNGLGIDLKKYGDKLFGMYKTFHENKDAKGIGLYITKNQIEAMNGKVIACSEVGKGTTFKIYFDEKN
ncbi:MAG: PAS domain-containing protein [Bacteroidota bacterium]